jgi:hypothetical protein
MEGTGKEAHGRESQSLGIFISLLNPGATNPKPGVYAVRASGR